MRVLVIIAECVQENSSANLCHLAYLRGLINAGNEVTLLSSDPRSYETDASMQIPDGVKTKTYVSITLYERLAKLKRKNKKDHTAGVAQTGVSSESALGKGSGLAKIKRVFLSLYGPHGIYYRFVTKASHFREEKPYDIVLSLSTPPASHLLAHKLLSSGRVISNHWIQIWEDPWSGDVFCRTRKDEVYKEEKRLLSFADRVCYVSPITLEYQKDRFPESAHKMYWVPLPSYYKPGEGSTGEINGKLFGYFGDYKRPARDLEPFYLAARALETEVNICGSTNLKLEATDHIRIYPRLSICELTPIEEKTGVLVFLSNHTGGQIPGKIYQYAATTKTILFILDGNEHEKRVLRDFFAPLNRFVFCDNNVESIMRAIQFICEGNLGEIQNRPLTQFEPEKIINRIMDEGTK